MSANESIGADTATVTSRVRITDLRSHPRQSEIYGFCTPDDDEKLRQTLARDGQRDPIIVRPTRGPKTPTSFEILDGHRRVRILLELGHIDVAAVIRDDLADDDAKADDLFLHINRDRRQLSPMAKARIEIAIFAKQRGREPGKFRGDDENEIISRLTAILAGSTKTGRRYFLILTQTPSEVQGAVERGNLPLQLATKAASLSPPLKTALAQEVRGLSEDSAIADAVLRYVAPPRPRSRARGVNPMTQLAAVLEHAMAEHGCGAENVDPGLAASYAATFERAARLCRCLAAKGRAGAKSRDKNVERLAAKLIDS